MYVCVFACIYECTCMNVCTQPKRASIIERNTLNLIESDKQSLKVTSS